MADVLGVLARLLSRVHVQKLLIFHLLLLLLLLVRVDGCLVGEFGAGVAVTNLLVFYELLGGVWVGHMKLLVQIGSFLDLFVHIHESLLLVNTLLKGKLSLEGVLQHAIARLHLKLK